MFKAYYRSSFTALVAGVFGFAVSLLAMRLFQLSERLVFAPGVVIQTFLNRFGADLPDRVAVFATLLAWCLVADALFLAINRPWRGERETARG